MKNSLYLLFILSIASGCQKTAPKFANYEVLNYKSIKLVWNDEFDNNSLDTTKWEYRAEGSTRAYGIVDNNKCIEQNGDGFLHVKVIENKINNQYLIGQIGTENIYKKKYGYFECRAQVNKNKGAHVAFWLQSPHIGLAGEPEKNGAEIDIFEYHRLTPEDIYHTIHWGGYGAEHRSISKTIHVKNINNGFHTFGLLWTPEKYSFFINGIKTWETYEAVSQIEQYMILSTELNGWGGNPAKGKYPDEMIVDYIRVYDILNKDSLTINILSEIQ